MTRILALAMMLVLTSAVEAGDGSCTKGVCPVGEKVAKLTEGWKAALSEAKAQCPIEHGKIAATFASLRKECPMGSRMGETLAFMRLVLESSVAADPDCVKACAQKTGATGASAEACPAAAGGAATCGSPELCALMSHRSQAARGLHQLVALAMEGLASFDAARGQCGAGVQASAPGCPSAAKTGATVAVEGKCCEKGTEAATVASEKCCDKGSETAAAGKAACPALAAASGGAGCCAEKGSEVTVDGAKCCPKALAAKGVELRASWEKVPGEYASMCPDKKRELFASLAELQKASRMMGLLPETLLALSEGFEGLDAVNTKVAEYVQAHPDAVKDVSCEKKTQFEAQTALVREAKDVLGRVRVAMEAVEKEGSGEAKPAVALQQ